jgi:hypothetical protein
MSSKKKNNSEVKIFVDKDTGIKASKDKGFKHILVRVPESILSEIDGWIEMKPWLNRTQWIVEAMYEKLLKDYSDVGQM